MRCGRLPVRPWSGKRTLLVLLTVGVASACAPITAGLSPYRVQVPLLHQSPSEYTVQGHTYRCYAVEDAEAIVRELKAACLALGGTAKECQTE